MIVQRNLDLTLVESKTAFAKRLGVTPGRVSQLIAEGLPVTATNKVPVGAALAWIRRYKLPQIGQFSDRGIAAVHRRQGSL